MDQNWCKPRKIIHLDQLDSNPTQHDQQFIQQKWKIIEETICAYLLQDTKPPSIVHLNRALQAFLVRNMYEELYQNLIKTFYKIYKSIVNQNFLKNCSLTSLLAYYIHKKHHYRIFFDVLNSFLNSYSSGDKLTIEQQAYRILSKEVLNSPFFDKFNQEFQQIVHQFRITKDQTEMLSLEYQLKIVSFLSIYQYFDQEFIDKSKSYYVNLAQSMVKNQDIFIIIDHVMKREIALNKLLKPSENTLGYLEKELIEEYYPFMIEYMEYLIQQSKYDKLKLLWSYTMRLNEQQKQLLYLRFKQIVKDIGRYVKEDENITKMLLFIDNIIKIIRNCFESNKIMFNTLYNTIQEILSQKQQEYNAALAHKMLKSQEKQTYEVVQQLFKYIPNKQKFIKQLEVYFFKWIMNDNVQDATYQQGIVQIIKKECGNTLCKKIERMLYDVWREGEMLYYEYKPSNFRCRLLSLNDWPKIKFKNILIPDTMSMIIFQFENQFKKSPQNASKELIWVNELGTLKLAINGVESLFSQIQAALIFILNRSFRPMKKEQLVQITQGDSQDIGRILDDLRQTNILQYNQRNQTYDINDSNTQSYFYMGTQESKLEEVSSTEKRDNSTIIDAAIVRTMKKKKLLPKTELTNFVFQMMKNFKPSLEEMNSSIERLAKRDFIEIDKMKGIIRYRE